MSLLYLRTKGKQGSQELKAQLRAERGSFVEILRTQEPGSESCGRLEGRARKERTSRDHPKRPLVLTLVHKDAAHKDAAVLTHEGR